MPPISRREQVELDELLSDIYRGIETLPDHQLQSDRSYIITRSDTTRDKSPIIGRANVRQYELPASSPLVKQHKQAIAASKQDPYNLQAQPQRPTLKRQTGVAGSQTPDNYNSRQPPQSLASFLDANPVASPYSTTPENKRRVRIVDDPRKSVRQQTSVDDADEFEDDDEEEYALNDYYTEPQANQFDSVYVSTSPKGRKKEPKEKVKYVNTNKLIYHQETDLDNEQAVSARNLSDNDDDDIDGVTRTEYYHTTWLDRQLGRANERRSSKELNERQVKEKAMIEELKRSLKNGAITLRQSFKGKKNNNKHKASDIFDDQLLDTNNNSNFNLRDPYNSRDQPQVVKTGIATLPRLHHKKSNNHNQSNKKYEQKTSYWSQTLSPQKDTKLYRTQRFDKEEPHKSQASSSSTQVNSNLNEKNYKTSSNSNNNNNYYNQSIKQNAQPLVSKVQAPMQTTSNLKDNTYQVNSCTLPYRKPEQPHQLLKSHYRGNLTKGNTLHRIDSSRQQTPTPLYNTSVNQQYPQSQQQLAIDKMKNPAHNNYYNNNINNANCASPNLHGGNKSPLQQSIGVSISGIPSATEVVRSALSRSNSTVSLNQLNKTINLLPNSPPAPSPMTPTHQMRPASPSLTPSPALTPIKSQLSHEYSSKSLGHQYQPSSQYLPGQTVLHGSRTIERPSQFQPKTQFQHQTQQQQQQQATPITNQQATIYANPHASLMQHRMEQQSKQPNRNVASIREFNELDSLLRSLSPGMPGSSTTHITPGFSNKPAQASLGGYMPANYQQQPASSYNASNKPTAAPTADVYAKVQKQPTTNLQAQAQAQQQQQKQPTGPGFQATSQPYTIDVTNPRLDENCVQRQRQDVSEFESPIELLPSMEDYQNITKLNPVKNHYWYKPNMTRELAIHLLKDKPQGTFIVRDSTSFKGAYGLAVKVSKLPKNILASLRNTNGDQSAEYIRHFLIEPISSGVRLKGYANEPVFDNLPDLIYQHSLTELALPCKLIIPRADIEDSRFNQKQKQFFDEFIASKEQAKHQPYERTSPDGGYRRYPGDVLVHNEHRIIFQ